MFETDINITHPEPTQQAQSFSPLELISFDAPVILLTQAHEPLSFAPQIASLESVDPSILQLQDVITLDKNMLDKTLNATFSSENDYFDDQSLISQIHQQKTKEGETAWFALRAYTPTHKYDTPR